ncbi:hypothetical protein V6N11_054870 [Hibiscus sabdariffa]|uniref:stearoyl-[acyl-carrier-protein] 9-desaturase n=1 Tax=Hibiscus sabdariffa TaxID=183260 RepID=A0ABR2P368_9ROSI
MALKLDNMSFGSQRLPSVALPVMANFGSPKFFMASPLRSASKKVENMKKTSMPHQEVQVQPTEKSWQPQDFLPDSKSDGFYEQIKELQERTKEILDDHFVALKLPSVVVSVIASSGSPKFFMACPFHFASKSKSYRKGQKRFKMIISSLWAWTAEENMHGDLLNKYLYFSGRVDMRQIEKTIQYLIGSGMVNGNLFNNFSIVAQRLGVYTTKDYTDILVFLVDRWKVKDLTRLSADGRKAQEFVCELPSRLRKLEEKAQLAEKQAPTIPFSWIPDRVEALRA